MDKSRSRNFVFLDLGPTVPAAKRYVILRLKANIIDKRSCVRDKATLVETFSPCSWGGDVTAVVLDALKLDDTLPIPPAIGPTPPQRQSSCLSAVKARQSNLLRTLNQRSAQSDSHTTYKTYSGTRCEDSSNGINEFYILARPCFLPLQGMASTNQSTFELSTTLICKDSWTQTHAGECDGAIFAPLRGQFGIPDVWGYTLVEEDQKSLVDDY